MKNWKLMQMILRQQPRWRCDGSKDEHRTILCRLWHLQMSVDKIEKYLEKSTEAHRRQINTMLKLKIKINNRTKVMKIGKVLLSKIKTM